MKRVLIILVTLIPVLIFAQDQENIKNDPFKMPVLSVSTDRFRLSDLSFNRLVSGSNEELLEVEFQLHNRTDDPMNLYIFVLATHEKHFITTSSFQRPHLEDRDEIKVIKTYPDNLDNFKYSYKNEKGEEKTEILKYPKNVKLGINQATGQAYALEERMIFRSYHPFRDFRKYSFFNQITILIFDDHENLIFRDTFKVRPKRR